MYSFTDTNEAKTQKVLPSEAMFVNGEALEDLVEGYRTLGVSGRELLESEIESLRRGRSNGEKFKYKRNPSRVIEVSYLLIAKSNDHFRQAFNELSRILNQEEMTLLFNDEKDKYFVGSLAGIGDVPKGTNSVVGTFQIYCSDPFKYANQTNMFTTQSDLLTLENKGTYKSYPILEATMPADNGVVAFINQHGKILQFGNPDELNEEPYVGSDRVIWDTVMVTHAEQSRGWKTNEYQFTGLWNGTERLNANGTRRFGNDSGYGFVEVADYGAGTQGFRGITYGRKLSPDNAGNVGAKHFESRHGVWFETTNINQTGIFITELRDAAGNALCSVVFYKLSASNNTAVIRINVRGHVREERFQPTAWNIYSRKGREFSIVKEGNLLRMHIGGIANGGFIHTIRLDEIRDMEVTDVVYYIGTPIQGNPLRFMRLTHSTFRKDNANLLRNVENLFGEGDVLRIDCKDGTATVNGIEMLGLGSLGNNWEDFFLDPGINQIQCIASSWAQRPTFRLYNQEVFL